jgi:Kef-type K+ transport system membrane component KefB
MQNKELYTVRDIKINSLISLTVLIIYLFNRFYVRQIVNYKTLVGGFIAFHLNDFLCGIFFLAIYSLLIRKEIKKFWVCILLISICAMFWECVLPYFRAYSYGDWKDVIAYICGGISYWVIIIMCNYRAD